MNYQEFKEKFDLNRNYYTYSSKALARIFRISEEKVRDYRAKMKKDKQSTLEEVPTIEHLEAINYKIQQKTIVSPPERPGFQISSFKQRGNEIGEVWYKREDNDVIIPTINFDSFYKKLSEELSPIRFRSNINKNSIKSQLICVSDVHCGMLSEDWTAEKMYSRFNEILNNIEPSNNVKILHLGDGIDGLNGNTVKGSFRLPQNMSNQEQILNLVSAFKLLFDGLALKVQAGVINSFEFHSVCESNHSGDMDYVVGKFLEMWLNVKYPDVVSNITLEPFGFFSIGKYNIIFHHGKDASNQKYPFPINLNDKTELHLSKLLEVKGIEFLNPKTTLIISGDAHVQSMNQGKFFKYFKVPAMAPSSDYIKANYGAGEEGVQYFKFYEHKFETGTIEFK